MTRDAHIEDLLRRLAPQVLGALVRRHGQFDSCEDAVQEALLAASMQWERDGVPANPQAWLVTVAQRRLVDHWRHEQAARRYEAEAAALEPADSLAVTPPDQELVAEADDTLRLLFLCCHPALSPASRIALTLRAVAGLTTAEISRAFLVPEASMGQRISRAKLAVKASDIGFGPPQPEEREERLGAVLHILYLIFNEGYTATSGEALQRPDLTAEAIRLARELRRRLPEDGEVAGLLALMLLIDARRPARTRSDGSLVPLAEQERALWRADEVCEGVDLLTEALSTNPLGPYQLQAAIAAVHAEAKSSEETDWPQIVGLYELLERISPSPMVTLNRAVAVAMAQGSDAGLEVLRQLDEDRRLKNHHRLAAVRAHLLEMAGDRAAALPAYLEAATRTTSVPERRYLEARADALRAASDGSAPG